MPVPVPFCYLLLLTGGQRRAAAPRAWRHCCGARARSWGADATLSDRSPGSRLARELRAAPLRTRRNARRDEEAGDSAGRAAEGGPCTAVRAVRARAEQVLGRKPGKPLCTPPSTVTQEFLKLPFSDRLLPQAASFIVRVLGTPESSAAADCCSEGPKILTPTLLGPRDRPRLAGGPGDTGASQQLRDGQLPTA